MDRRTTWGGRVPVHSAVARQSAEARHAKVSLAVWAFFGAFFVGYVSVLAWLCVYAGH